MKITDMDIDCLESCIEYLETEELFNVANSNKRLNKAASYVLASRFSGEVSFCNSFYHPGEQRWQIFPDKCTKINELSMGLQFLRCFGHLISNLTIIAKDCSAFNDNITSYINQYCSETLRKISIAGSATETESILTFIEKPFKNVKTVNYYFGHVLIERDWFNRYFPQLSHLTYRIDESKESSKHQCIENHFPHLERLDINIWSSKRCDIESVKCLLHLNPQVKRVVLTATNSIFCDLVESVRYIETLDLDISDDTTNRSTGADNNPINLKNVKTFIIRTRRKIPYQFDRLETLKIEAFGPTLTDILCEFAEIHSTLTTLEIFGRYIRDRNTLLRIANALPALKSAAYRMYTIRINYVIEFLDIFRQLDIFHLKLDTNESFEMFLEHFSPEWEIKKDDFGYIEMKRKN